MELLDSDVEEMWFPIVKVLSRGPRMDKRQPWYTAEGQLLHRGDGIEVRALAHIAYGRSEMRACHAASLKVMRAGLRARQAVLRELDGADA